MGTGGEQQLVEAEPLAGPVGPPHLEDAGVEVDALGGGAQAQVDAERGVGSGGAGDELVAAPDVARDPVGDAAGGVGGVRATVQHHDVERATVRLRRPQRLVGGGHAGRIGPDDHDALHPRTVPIPARAGPR